MEISLKQLFTMSRRLGVTLDIGEKTFYLRTVTGHATFGPFDTEEKLARGVALCLRRERERQQRERYARGIRADEALYTKALFSGDWWGSKI